MTESIHKPRPHQPTFVTKASRQHPSLLDSEVGEQGGARRNADHYINKPLVAERKRAAPCLVLASLFPLAVLLVVARLPSLLLSLRKDLAAFPRYRYDQLMGLGQKVFLPLSLARVVLVSGVSVTFQLLP